MIKFMPTVVIGVIALSSVAKGQSPSVPPAMSSADVVRYAQSAASDPLAPTAQQQRKAAMSFAENDHTTHVLLCGPVFQQMQTNHQANAGEITLQYIISAAAFLYEHPDAATDSVAQNAAGLNAALDVYEKFLTSDPHSRSKWLDSLEKKKADGKLASYVANTCK